MRGFAKDYLMSILIMKLLTSYDHVTSQILPTAFIYLYVHWHAQDVGNGGGTFLKSQFPPPLRIPEGKNFQNPNSPKYLFEKQGRAIPSPLCTCQYACFDTYFMIIQENTFMLFKNT